MAAIGDLGEIARGASPRPIQDFITTAPDGVNWIKIGDAQIGTKFISKTKEKVSPEGAKKSRYVKPGDFILSNSMSFGRPYIMATDGCRSEEPTSELQSLIRISYAVFCLNKQ